MASIFHCFWSIYSLWDQIFFWLFNSVLFEEQGLTAYPKVSWMLCSFVPTYQVLWLQAYTTWLDFFLDEFCDNKDLEMASCIVMFVEFQCYSIEKYKYYISVFFFWKRDSYSPSYPSTMKLRLGLNLKTSCLPLLSTRILALCDYTQLYLFWRR